LICKTLHRTSEDCGSSKSNSIHQPPPPSQLKLAARAAYHGPHNHRPRSRRSQEDEQPGTIGFLVAITSNFAPAFETAYGFKPWHSGLCFIAALIGAFIGIFVGGHFSDWIADRQTERNGDVREREMRLPAILVSVVIAPLALILYGVGIQYKLHWICPTIALGLSRSFSFSSHHPIEANNRSQVLHRSSYQFLACRQC
jgi:MFS family permease